MSDITVGQIGCGYWGKNLLRVLVESNNVEVRRVADISPQTCDYIRLRYPALAVGEEEMEIFSDPAIDAVVIATPARDHFRAALLALNAGKHAFVEKPLSTTAEQAQKLVDLAASKRLTLMVGHTFLFNSVVNRLKELIETGYLGDIQYLYSRRLNLGIVRSDVNVLWNLAPHDVSIFQYWLDSEPEKIVAVGGTYLQECLEDVVFATLKYPGGKLANIHLSWLDPQKVRTITVVGSKRMAVFNDVSSDARLVIHDTGIDISQSSIETAGFETFGEFQVSHRHGDTVIPRIPYPEPLVQEIQHFLYCVRSGVEPLSGGAHPVSVVRTIERIQAAMDKADDLPNPSVPTRTPGAA